MRTKLFLILSALFFVFFTVEAKDKTIKMGKNIVYTGGFFEKAPCGSGGISCIDPKTKCIIYQIKGVYQKESIKDVKIFVDGYVQWECDNAKFSVSKDELGNPFVLIRFDMRSTCKKKEIVLYDRKYESLTISQPIAFKYTFIKREKKWKESLLDQNGNSISKTEGEKPDLPLPNILLSYGYKQQDIKNAKIPVTICEAGVYSCDDATFYFNNKAQYKNPHLTDSNGDVLTLLSTGWSGTRHFPNGSFVTRREGGSINYCYKNGDSITIDNNDWYGTHTLADGSTISKKKGDDKILMTYQNGDWYEGTVKESLLKETNFASRWVTHNNNRITCLSSLSDLHPVNGKGVVDGLEEEWINGETNEVRYQRHLRLLAKYDEDLVELIESGNISETDAQKEQLDRKQKEFVNKLSNNDITYSFTGTGNLDFERISALQSIGLESGDILYNITLQLHPTNKAKLNISASPSEHAAYVQTIHYRRDGMRIRHQDYVQELCYAISVNQIGTWEVEGEYLKVHVGESSYKFQIQEGGEKLLYKTTFLATCPLTPN